MQRLDKRDVHQTKSAHPNIVFNPRQTALAAVDHHALFVFLKYFNLNTRFLQTLLKSLD